MSASLEHFFFKEAFDAGDEDVTVKRRLVIEFPDGNFVVDGVDLWSDSLTRIERRITRS